MILKNNMYPEVISGRLSDGRSSTGIKSNVQTFIKNRIIFHGALSTGSLKRVVLKLFIFTTFLAVYSLQAGVIKKNAKLEATDKDILAIDIVKCCSSVDMLVKYRKSNGNIDKTTLYFFKTNVPQIRKGRERSRTRYLFMPDTADFAVYFEMVAGKLDQGPQDICLIGPDKSKLEQISEDKRLSLAREAWELYDAAEKKAKADALAAVNLPEADDSNSDTEKGMLKALKKYKKEIRWEVEIYKKIIITENNWRIVRDRGGIIGRTREGAALLHFPKFGGTCAYAVFQFMQSYDGREYMKHYIVDHRVKMKDIECKKIAPYR